MTIAFIANAHPPLRHFAPVSLARSSLLLLALLAACGDGAARDSAAVAPKALDESVPVVAAPGERAVTPGTCPMFGQWRRCNVEERLRSAGWAPELVADSVRQDGLAIAGAAYRIGQAELQLFLYADSADARREAASADVRRASTAAVRGIRRPPAVIHSNNLVALFFSNNDRLAERVQLALTAGLPPA